MMNPGLFRALVHGDREEVEGITRRLVLVDDEDQLEARRRLLQGVTADGDTVLHVAARFGHHELVGCVYVEPREGRGVVDLLARSNRGDTALHCAATVEMVEALFAVAPAWRFSELLKATNKRGETCLHEAVRRGRARVVEVLVERDDDVLALQDSSGPPLVQIVDADGVSPLYLAATLDRADVVGILTDQARRHRASYAGPQGRTALHAAVLVNSTIITTALLDWNTRNDDDSEDLVRQGDESGSTPLHYLASSRSKPGIAELLLLGVGREEDDEARSTRRSAAYCSDSNGCLPIHVAAGHGRVDIIRLLLEECPDCVWSLNSSGQTFLHVAVQKERPDVVAYICGGLQQEDGIGMLVTTEILNARDKDGNTALHQAVLSASTPDLFCLLLRRREVDLNIFNGEGHTPLDLVILTGKVDPAITGTEGCYIGIPGLAFFYNGQRTLRYLQNRYDWMVYDLVIAGASRGVHRWEDIATRVPANPDVEKDWEKVGKSAGVLAVCAVLILNATLALPFNVGARYHDYLQKRHGPSAAGRRRAFRAFLSLDAMAFILSAVATFSCTYAGFATAENVSRRSHLFFGAGCLVGASFAIVPAFSLGMNAAFGTDIITLTLSLLPMLINVGTLSGMVVPFRLTMLHNKALIARLGTTAFRRSLFRNNRRMLCRFWSQHRPFLLAAFALVNFCILVATVMYQSTIYTY